MAAFEDGGNSNNVFDRLELSATGRVVPDRRLVEFGFLLVSYDR